MGNEEFPKESEMRDDTRGKRRRGHLLYMTAAAHWLVGACTHPSNSLRKKGDYDIHPLHGLFVIPLPRRASLLVSTCQSGVLRGRQRWCGEALTRRMLAGTEDGRFARLLEPGKRSWEAESSVVLN